jgi:hypothetical protein
MNEAYNCTIMAVILPLSLSQIQIFKASRDKEFARGLMLETSKILR